MVFATNALFAGVDKTTAADMTQANITTFEGFAFWMPLAFIIIGFLIFAFFVKIDEKAQHRPNDAIHSGGVLFFRQLAHIFAALRLMCATIGIR